MADHFKLYVFGDQTFDIQSSLHDLLQKRGNLFLQDLFRQAYHAIRVEVYKLPSQVRDGLPRFSCLEDLTLLYWEGTTERCIALDMALTTLYHLGVFIR